MHLPHEQQREKKLRVIERKVLRKIYEPTFNNKKQKWEIRTNAHQLYGREDMVQFIRETRIDGQVMCARQEEVC